MKDKIQYNFFMKVPNTSYGWDLIAMMKQFLNRDSYRIRLRGTGVDWDKVAGKHPRGWFRYSVPLCYAKEVRIYVHAKVPTWSQSDQVVGIDTIKRLFNKPFSKHDTPYTKYGLNNQ